MSDYSDFTYEMLPPSWLFCFLGGCPKAAQCVRHLSSTVIPNDKTVGFAVLPTALKGNGCKHFKQIRKIRAAYGFKTLFEDVKRKDDTPLRDQLKAFLGSHGSYYRYHNGTKLLTPEQQDRILAIFRRWGYTENLRFDHYKEVYDLE